MTALPIRLVCHGCGHVMDSAEAQPFRCARARSGDGIDHGLGRVLAEGFVPTIHDDPNPFIAFREMLYSYHYALAAGVTDESFQSLVRRLDQAVGKIDGRGFVYTPCMDADLLANEVGIGRLWVKNETLNVSGSHKARHLMAVAIHLAVNDLLRGEEVTQRLAIASCGNAALGAAVVARACERPIDVYVPVHADPRVLQRLRDLQASIHTCERVADTPGDPCYLAFLDAVAAGAQPFSCQGNDNALALEGGLTLGFEIAVCLRAAGTAVRHVVVQVGGGALASSVFRALEEAVRFGWLSEVPRLHTVQTQGAYPLQRAVQAIRVRSSSLAAPGGTKGSSPSSHANSQGSRDQGAVTDALAYAALHRNEFMWPWESEPSSIAGGILDDETYDWWELSRAMLQSGGEAIVVGEEALVGANKLAVAHAMPNVDETGTAGLAGLQQLLSAGIVEPDEHALVLFTGVRR